ncbi:hypothetical protein QFC21_004996 [Naganishia friedmannii]|uniref:Uncharacterized protein n=1 Tax=Naganishia friedmannii TaxID=89922 RepID=A0ACC2VCD5_9TREE|nr:hypothetical protein QFC21_004996 [Naganishia friedmannii]
MIVSLPVGAADLAYSVAFAVAESALDDHPSPSATGKTMDNMHLYDNTVTATHVDIHMDTPQKDSRRDSYRALPKPTKGTVSPWNCKPFSMIPSPSSRPSSPVTTQVFSTANTVKPVAARLSETALDTPLQPPGLFNAADKELRTMRANAPVFSCRSNSAGKMHTRSQSELLPSAPISSPPRTMTQPQVHQHALAQQQPHLGRPVYHRATASVASVPREKEEGMLPFPREVQPLTSRMTTGNFSDSINLPSATPTLAATTPAASPATVAAVGRSTPVRGRAGLPTLAEITAHYRAQGRTHRVTVSELQEIASPPLTSSPLPETNTRSASPSKPVENYTSSQAMVKRYSLESNDSYGSSQSYTSRSSADDTDGVIPTTPPPCDIVAFGTGAKVMPSSTGSNGSSRLPSFLRDRASPEIRKCSSPAPSTLTTATNSTLAKALAKQRRRAVSQHTASSPAPGSTSQGHARRSGSMDSYPMTATPPSRSILGMGTATPMVQVTPPSTKIASSATFSSLRTDNGNGNTGGEESIQSADRRWPRSMRPSASSGYTMGQQMKDKQSCTLAGAKFLSTGSSAIAAVRPQVTTTALPGAPLISFTPPTAPPAKADSSTCAEFEALVVDARARRSTAQGQNQVPRSPLVATHNTGNERDTRDEEKEDSLRRQRAERMLAALGKRRAEARSSPTAGTRTGMVMEI